MLLHYGVTCSLRGTDLGQQHCRLFLEITVQRDQAFQLRLRAGNIVLGNEPLGQIKVRPFQVRSLARFDDRDWMTTDQHLWFIAEYLFTIRHHPLLRPGMAKRLHRLDDRSFRAGTLGRAEK